MSRSPRLILRAGALEDVRELVRMHGRCSQLSLTRRYLAPMPVLSTSLAGRLLRPPGGFSFVAERGGVLAGIATVAPYVDADSWARASGPHTPARADVGQLVADHLQRQGIGTSLLLAAAREAGRRGFEELVMAVQPDNSAVLRLVHAAGLRARVGMRDGLTQIAVTLNGARRGEPTWPTPHPWPCPAAGSGATPALHSGRASAKNGLALST